MKSYQVRSLLAITAFAMLGTTAFAGTTTKPSRKEVKEACVAELQPAPAKGERLTPAQGEKVRECMAAKGIGHSKTHKPVAENTTAKKANPSKTN